MAPPARRQGRARDPPRLIPLRLKAQAEAERPFVTRLAGTNTATDTDARLIQAIGNGAVFAGSFGLIELEGVPAGDLIGDVILFEPNANRAERLIRANSDHN